MARDLRVEPDLRWIAYGSDVSGRNDIYVQPFPSTGNTFQITRGGGEFPLIMLFPSEQTTAGPSAARQEIQVVLNWFEELKQRVPAK